MIIFFQYITKNEKIQKKIPQANVVNVECMYDVKKLGIWRSQVVSAMFKHWNRFQFHNLMWKYSEDNRTTFFLLKHYWIRPNLDRFDTNQPLKELPKATIYESQHPYLPRWKESLYETVPLLKWIRFMPNSDDELCQIMQRPVGVQFCYTPELISSG